MKIYTNNRPISPHLLIYRPQSSSLGSIWHRITGISLLLILSFFIIELKFVLNSNFFTKLIYNSYDYFWIFLYISLLFIFLYHAFNGLRHILWDFGFLLHVKSLSLSLSLIIFLSFFITVLNLIYL
uniref:Succinate dehydrogenase cytochrome B560 subunit n=1 Tax=Betaphycus gelatinus TaxID=1191690 RepID=A0A2H4QI53_9FLOR|nr:succinate dehydrogenase cytochrome B560 subunit [Betaphycus gelatinus]ATX68835.1 succinate dehydrogenase cytochrome B560 subunit [Betaphycus gelatinus]